MSKQKKSPLYSPLIFGDVDIDYFVIFFLA
jgi:hypothetical protein